MALWVFLSSSLQSELESIVTNHWTIEPATSLEVYRISNSADWILSYWQMWQET